MAVTDVKLEVESGGPVRHWRRRWHNKMGKEHVRTLRPGGRIVRQRAVLMQRTMIRCLPGWRSGTPGYGQGDDGTGDEFEGVGVGARARNPSGVGPLTRS